MDNSKKHNYIRDDLIIDFPIPKSIQEMIEEAELLDEEKNIEFLCVADMIDTLCKNCYAAGKITMEQWDLITAKYSVNADGF